MRDARVAADAVDPVDREVAGLELVGDRVVAPRREPRRGARVLAGAEEVLLGGDGDRARRGDEAVRERRLDRLDVEARADELPHALERPVPARRDDQPVAPRGELRQPRRELRGVALRAPPIGEPQVESLRELREMQPHVLAERLVERMEHVRTRPADRLGQRLALVVRLARAVLRALRLRQHHPRPVRQQLGHRRHVVEHERRQRLGALDEQPVGHALQPVAEPVAPAAAPGVRRARGSRRPGSARAPTGRARARSWRSRAASTWRTRGAIRSPRPSTPGGPDAARRRGTRRRRRRAPRTRRDARSDRLARSPGRPAGRRARRGPARGPRPARAAGRRRAWGSGPASRRARARPPRTHPSPRAAGGSRRRGGRRSRGSGRCPRTAAPPTRAAARRVRRPGTRRSRRRAPPPRADPATPPGSACPSRGRDPRSPRPGPPRRAPRSAGRAPAGAARTAPTRSTPRAPAPGPTIPSVRSGQHEQASPRCGGASSAQSTERVQSAVRSR